MTSFDTNVLFFAFTDDRPEHLATKAFLAGYSTEDNVVICEFVLVELYRLLRNPVLLKNPLGPKEAVQVVQVWRQHPRWPVVGFSHDSKRLHDDLWRAAENQDFGVRRIFDARLAFVLREHGVTDFATANVKDFQGFGFKRVWNPLVEPPDAL